MIKPAPSYDALIAGAGPAALLCSLTLHRRGLRVLLLGPADSPAPQSSHVHVFNDRFLQQLIQFMPELRLCNPPPRDAVSEEDDTVGRCREKKIARPFLSRRLLDLALLDLLDRSTIARRPAKFLRARRESDHWLIETSDEELIRAGWLIDATGSTRATAHSLAKATGQPVPLDEADAPFSYCTWRLSNCDPEADRQCLRFWSASERVAALLAPDGDHSLLTLQSISKPTATPPDCPVSILRKIGASSLAQLLARAQVLGPPKYWRGAPITCIDLQSMSPRKMHWFPVGDALITTPPILGWGYEQALEQCVAVDEALSKGALHSLHSRLGALTGQRFQQAMIIAYRRSVALPSGAESARPAA